MESSQFVQGRNTLPIPLKDKEHIFIEKSRILEVSNYHGRGELSLRTIFKDHGSIASIIFVEELFKAYITFYTSEAVEKALATDHQWVINKERLILSRPAIYHSLKEECKSELAILLKDSQNSVRDNIDAQLQVQVNPPSKKEARKEQKKAKRQRRLEAKAARKANAQGDSSTSQQEAESNVNEALVAEESSPQANEKGKQANKQKKTKKPKKKNKAEQNGEATESTQVANEPNETGKPTSAPETAEAANEGKVKERPQKREQRVTDEEFTRAVLVNGPGKLVKNLKNLKEFFADVGTISNIAIRQKITIVVFSDADAVQKAIALDNTNFKEFKRPVRVFIPSGKKEETSEQ